MYKSLKKKYNLKQQKCSADYKLQKGKHSSLLLLEKIPKAYSLDDTGHLDHSIIQIDEIFEIKDAHIAELVDSECKSSVSGENDN